MTQQEPRFCTCPDGTAHEPGTPCLTQQDSWIERFDKRFPWFEYGIKDQRPKVVKQFIASEIERAREEGYKKAIVESFDSSMPLPDKIRQSERERIIGVVEKMRLIEQTNGTWKNDTSVVSSDLHRFARGVNSALDNLLEELKK